ncbi:MAG: late competence development ComFB family protein [Peptostreptococcaceae bacterium]|nr:late competence development ComFB family protein [Peptostreptococcaceae bacterium]
MSRRSNKTARVLSLITGGKDTEIVNEEGQVQGAEKTDVTSLNDPKQSNESPSNERSASGATVTSSADPSEPERPLPPDAHDIPKDPAERPIEKQGQDLSLEEEKKPKDHSTDEILESPKDLSPDRSTGDPSTDAPVEDNTEDAPMGQFKKFMSERMANSNQKKNSAPIVEILFNDHDPLSDMIRDQLQAEEAMTDAVGIRSIMMMDEKKNEPVEELEEQPFVTHDASSGKVKIKTADGSESDELDYKFVNVFEEIVRSKVLDAMQKFGVCTCDRCIVDVVALTVTSLPAKCIVADKDAIFPLLSYYSSKYATIVQTELVKACVKIKENPHHK